MSSDPSRSGEKKLLQPDVGEVPTSDITAEKKLTDLLFLTVRLPKNKFNIISTTTLFIVLVAYTLLTSRSFSELASDVYRWSELGFSFSTSILGFLVAGFAIFAAINDPKLFVGMARTRHSSGLSYLKYNFLTLMYVFIVYLCFAIICFLIQILSQPQGPLATILLVSFKIFNWSNLTLVKSILVRVTLAILGTWFFYSIMLLQAFIFNIYHILMTTIQLKAEEEDDQNNS